MISRLIALASFLIGSGIIIFAEVRWKVYLEQSFYASLKSPHHHTNPEKQIAHIFANAKDFEL